MRQRYAYGSNIAAVRCGWDVKIKEQWRIKDCNLQSAAVLWLRHGFARAFSCDSLLLCWGFLENLAIVIASECNERGNQTSRTLNTFDCFAYARNDERRHRRSDFSRTYRVIANKHNVRASAERQQGRARLPATLALRTRSGENS